MSQAHPSARRSEGLREQVVRSIRTDIAAGRLRHGERLLPSRELAAQFGVSDYTINEAMAQLADEGLVITKARSARTVHAPDQLTRSGRQSAVPQVVFIGGYAGSGKSELGRILARETGWTILDKDTITRYVVESALEISGQSRNDRESQTYLEKIRPGEYDCLLDTTIENVQCGNSAIVTAPFVREFADESWIQRCITRMQQFNARTSLLWIQSDIETMHTYIRRRGAGRDAYKLGSWDEYSAEINTAFAPAGPHRIIQNSLASAPLEDQARAFLTATLDANDSEHDA